MDYLIELSVFIVPVFFVFALIIFSIFGSQKNNENKKSLKKNKKIKALSSLMMLIGMFIVALLVYIFVVAPIFKSSTEGISGFFENKADHKAHCQTHPTVTEAKTDFAAKQAYEKCMDK